MRRKKPPGSRYEQPCSARPANALASASTNADPKRPVGHASRAPKSSSRRMTGKRAYSDGPTYTERSIMRIGVSYTVAALLLLCLDQGAGRCQAGVQVECGTGDQNVQPQSQHADRLAFAHFADGRIADVGAIHDGHAAAALDFDGFVGA